MLVGDNGLGVREDTAQHAQLGREPQDLVVFDPERIQLVQPPDLGLGLGVRDLGFGD